MAVWHRRAGKDEVALHYAATRAVEDPATMWHMLPEYKQGRKAIWNAVNPHTHKKRREEAFPEVILAKTNDQEMYHEFITGATWQVVGSDNYNSLVGSPPKIVIKSEWALANPATQAYIAPILLENNGTDISIYTPRGRNHGYSTYIDAKNDPDAFAQILTVEDTGVFTQAQLDKALREYVAIHGQEFGEAVFQQEYYCSFEAAIIGSYYGAELTKARNEGRIGFVPHDPQKPVFTAFDLGWNDSTAIWFFQIIGQEIRVIDYYENNTKPPDHYAKLIKDKPYIHQRAYLPHDANNGDPAVSLYTQYKKLGLNPRVLEKDSLNAGIQAVRTIFNRCRFDEKRCAQGLNALTSYQREWNEKKKAFDDQPKHDWTSHGADAFRYLAQALRFRNEDEDGRGDFSGTRNAGPTRSVQTYDPFGRWQ